MFKPFPVHKEYVKNPEIRPEDVRNLREWLKTQPHLPEEKITDLDLILMYHSCERSTEVTKQVLDLHYTLRTQAPVFQDLHFDEKTEAMVSGMVSTLLPESTAEGYRVFYARVVDTDPKIFNISLLARNFTIQLDLWQQESGSWPGLVLVLDMDGISLGHLARIDLTVLQHFLYYLQEALPTKLRAAHFLNAPPFMETVLGLLKGFLSSSIISLITVHRDANVEGITLPRVKEYGRITEQEISFIKANAATTAAIASKTVDEARRRGGGGGARGGEGSFKKLEID